MLAAINFTHIVDVMILMPLGDMFMSIYNINPSQFSILVASYAIGAFLSSLIGIFYLDIFDRKRALLFIYTGFIVGTIACGFTNSYESLLAIRFITGLFGGMIGALVLSVVSDLYKFEERGKAMGIIMGAFSAAAALGVPIGLYFADLFSWRIPFFLIGGVGLINLSILYFYFPNMKAHLKSINQDRSPFRVLGAVFNDKNQVNALILGFVLVLGHFIIIPFITPYMTRNIGFDQSQITYIYFLGGVLTVFSAPIFGALTDKIGAVKLFTILMTISFIPVYVLTNLPPVPVFVALIVTSSFFVLGSGRFIPPNTLITAAAGTASRGSFMSIKSALQQLAVGSSSIIGGLIITFDDDLKLEHYNVVGYISIATCILGIFLVRRIKVAKGN
jgi:predicted MFS family arabinose efflux permease